MCTHTRSSTPCHPPSLTHTPYLRKCCIAAIPMKSEETSVHLNIYQPGLLEGTVCIHVTFSPLLPSWYSLWVSFYLLSIQMSQQTSGSSQSPPCMTVARGQGEQLRHLLLPIDFPVLPLLRLGVWGFSAHVYPCMSCAWMLWSKLWNQSLMEPPPSRPAAFLNAKSGWETVCVHRAECGKGELAKVSQKPSYLWVTVKQTLAHRHIHQLPTHTRREQVFPFHLPFKKRSHPMSLS